MVIFLTAQCFAGPTYKDYFCHKHCEVRNNYWPLLRDPCIRTAFALYIALALSSYVRMLIRGSKQKLPLVSLVHRRSLWPRHRHWRKEKKGGEGMRCTGMRADKQLRSVIRSLQGTRSTAQSWQQTADWIRSSIVASTTAYKIQPKIPRFFLFSTCTYGGSRKARLALREADRRPAKISSRWIINHNQEVLLTSLWTFKLTRFS